MTRDEEEPRFPDLGFKGSRDVAGPRCAGQAPTGATENLHVRDKIRQQLQRLRDLGFVEFLGRGIYRTL